MSGPSKDDRIADIRREVESRMGNSFCEINVDDILFLLGHLEAAEAANRWQPITDEQKDGKTWLCLKQGLSGYFFADWDPSLKRFTSWTTVRQPTHFLPLPAPPEVERG